MDAGTSSSEKSSRTVGSGSSSASLAFDATVDSARNLARARFRGHLVGSNVTAAADEMVRILPQLRPGFTLFADFSAVLSMDLETVTPLTRIMELCRTHGIGTIVRILPAPDRDIGINLLGLVHYRGRVKTITVDTLAEAERVLS